MKFGVEFYDLMAQNPEFLQLYVDDTFNTLYDSAKWKDWGVWAATPSKNGMFMKTELALAGDVMADITARFSETKQITTEGLNWYSDKIPNLSKGLQQNLEDMVQAQEIADMVNGDNTIVEQFTNKLRPIIGGQHSAITHMSAQLASTGSILMTSGIGFKHTAPIPTANFRLAGAKVWSDSTSLIITEMIKAENYADFIGMPKNRVWEMTQVDFDNILKNEEVKTTVGQILFNYGQTTFPNLPVTVDQFNLFVTKFNNRLSPIQIVAEKQVVQTGTEKSLVSGWHEGNVTLRPAGKIFTIEYNALPEFQILGQEQGINVAYLENGKIVVKRKFNPIAEVWTTDVFCSAIPTFNSWKYQVIIDTKTAGTTA